MRSLKKFSVLLSNVKTIELNNDIYRSIRFNNINKRFKFIIELSRFIFQSISPGEENSIMLSNFLYSDTAMSAIFEKFLRNFYKLELKAAEVSAERLKWVVSDLSDDTFKERVPNMLTDISLISQDHVLIIDAKFYQDALVARKSLNFKYRRDHLSQLMEYLRISSRKYAKQASGVLIYPTVGVDLNDFGFIEGYPISVCTIDLSKDWQHIKKNLLQIYSQSKVNNNRIAA